MIDGKIDPGMLDQRIAIKKKTDAIDATGGVTPTWTYLTEGVFCKVDESLKSNEGTRGEDQQVVAFRVTTFTIRSPMAVDETMRIVFGADEYDVLSVTNVSRSGYLIIEAEKRDNQT